METFPNISAAQIEANARQIIDHIRNNDPFMPEDNLYGALGRMFFQHPDVVRLMIWTDKDHPAPADLVITGSHTPEPPEPTRVSSGEVFRLRMPLASRQWRTPSILMQVIRRELSRDDLPNAVSVSPKNPEQLERGVLIEALYGISAIEASGVFYSSYLSEFVVKP